MNKYDVIIADPPWHYGASVNMGGKQVSELYKTMKLKEMMKIDISPIVKPSTLLFMWTTGPKMNEALQLIEAWGFQYKTVAYVWKKGTHKNMGRYSMSQCEYVLVSKRKGTGSFKPDVWNQPQMWDSAPTRHSAKPEKIQDRIETTWGDRRRLELFARRFRKGWDCVGNEINGTLEDFLDGKHMRLQ
jgi:N6-adenosine-specific RNA methylase IME4